uniref:hypothetical protein n=1 Tax=Tolypothrix sp. PCC 7601 TaxID=1188 RepID=UPI0005EAB140
MVSNPGAGKDGKLVLIYGWQEIRGRIGSQIIDIIKPHTLPDKLVALMRVHRSNQKLSPKI